MNPEKKSETAVFGNTLLEFQKESKKPIEFWSGSCQNWSEQQNQMLKIRQQNNILYLLLS